MDLGPLGCDIVSSRPFDSYAQNGEDVVLWRALSDVPAGTGRYVDIGANDPVVYSITWAFYTRGWRGVTADPVPAYAAAHRARRPEDVQVECVVGELDTDTVVLHQIDDTGLSTIDGDIAGRHATAGWEVTDVSVPVRRLDDVLVEAGYDDGRPIHLLTVDTEGSEREVLESIDLQRFRPWVLVVEATAPLSATPTHERWEHLVTDAGYVFCLFDGLSRFYVAKEHAERLAGPLSYPVCALDDHTTLATRGLSDERDAARAERDEARREVAELTARRAEAVQEAVRWRTAALTRWNTAVGATDDAELRRARDEVEAIRRTVSWRVTRPLRAVRTRAGAWRAAQR